MSRIITEWKEIQDAMRYLNRAAKQSIKSNCMKSQRWQTTDDGPKLVEYDMKEFNRLSLEKQLETK